MKAKRSNPLVANLLRRHFSAATLLIAVGSLSLQPTAEAANLVWDANGLGADITNGSGTWNTSDSNWWDGAANVAWSNGNTAIIGANPLSGAGGTITFTDLIDISVQGLQVADNANTTNHTLAPPATGLTKFIIGPDGISAADGITISQTIHLGGDQSWVRAAGGNGALTILGTMDDDFVVQNLSLSSSLGSATVGIIHRGPGFHDGTTTFNDGYFQTRHDSFGISTIFLNGTIGGNQRIQFVNAAGTGVSGTLAYPVSINSGKEGNFHIWGGTTTSVSQAISGGDATSVIRKNDSGTLLFEANNTYTGATIIDAGTITLGTGGSTGAIDSSGSLTINGSGVLSINRSGSTNLSAILPGNAGDIYAPFTANDAQINFSGPTQSDSLVIDQDLGTSNAFGQLRVSRGTMDLASGTDLQLRSISVGHSSLVSGNVGTLNVGTGSTVTLATGNVVALNAGDSSGNSGIVNITGGSVSLPGNNSSGAVRIGHWNATGNQLNISAGSLSVPAGRINIGWDGEATMNMSGGTITTFAMSIDGNGNGPAASASLTGGEILLGGNGLGTAGQGTLTANGGKIISTAGNTLSVPRTILAGGLTTGFGSATTNINITDNSVTTGTGPLTIVNESATGEKNYTINTNSPSYSGAVSVPNGVRLQLQQANALGTASVTIPSGAGAYLTATSAAYPTNFSIAGSGWTEATGLLGALRLQGATISGNIAIDSGGSRITAHSGSNGTLSGALTGNGALEINSTVASNNGTITLAGNGSGFTGPISVPQGRLNITGSVGGDVSVIDGSTLGGEGTVAGNLTLGGTTPVTLNINPTTPGAISIGGNVTLTGTNAVTFSVPPTSTGTITVFTYSGSLSGTPVADLVLANAGSYRSAIWNDTGSAVTLSLSNKNLSWTGSAGGTWDLGSTSSWTDGSPSTFFWGDNVTFPDLVSNQTIAMAGGNLAPASMTFTANTTEYVITASSPNQLTGSTAFLKSGSALLTMGGTNAYTGGTVLSKGQTRVRATAALGTGTVTLGDANTGADNVSLYLDDTARVNFNTPVVISNNGTGTMTLGSRASTGTGDNNQFTNITLQRDVIFDSNAADRTDFETISGTGNITINGTGRALFMTANTFVGNLTLNNTNLLGLQIGTNSTAFNAIPDASNVTVNAGSTLALSFTAGGSETIAGLNGAGNVRNNGGNANTLVVGTGNADGSFSGSISNGGAGAFSLTKTGNGTQTLSGVNSSYTGTTTINGGVLEAAALANGGVNSSIGSAASNVVFGSAASTLRYIGASNVSIDRSFTLSSGTTGAGGSIESSGLGAWTIPAAVAINYGTVDQARSLTIGGTGVAANTFAGTITNNGTGVTNLVKSGTGTWLLTANNSFTGPLSITGGRLNLSFIGNGGAASQVGQSPKAGANLNLNGGTLAYTGISASTDRGFSTGTAGGTIEVLTGTSLTFGSASSAFALAGTLTKTGAGTLNLTTYTGSTATAASDIVIDDGVVNFGSGYFNASPFGYRALAITVNPNGILRTSTSHALGGDNVDGGTSWGQVRLIGGQWNHTAGGQYVSAGTVSGEGRLVMQGASVTGAGDIRATSGGTVVTSLASATTSIIGNSGGTTLQYGPLTFDIADGAAASDLSVTSAITSPAGSTNTLTKTGDGLLLLGGVNTYTGTTNVNAGTLELADNARLRFVIPAAGASNKLTGTGTGTLKGDFAIDITAAAALTSGTWVLEDLTSSSYESTFTVMTPAGTPWTDAGGNKWTTPGAVSGTVWTFEEGTGTLTLAAPAGYDSWATQITNGKDERAEDADDDGFTNLQEFLFGTDPMASNGSLTTTERSGADLIIRWRERTPGAGYTLLESATLANPWNPSAAPITTDGALDGDYQPVKATVTIGAGSNFFRVEGVEN